MPEITTTQPVWRSEPTPEAARANDEIISRATDLVRARDRAGLLSLVADWTPSEVLSCLLELRSEHAAIALGWLPDDFGLNVLAQLDPRFHVLLFRDETRSKFRQLVAGMDGPSALRLLEDLPPDYAEDLLTVRPDADHLRMLLASDMDTAAAVMRRNALAVPESWTVGDVIADLRARADGVDRIDSLHVVDADDRLLGYLRIRDLLHHPQQTQVAAIARRDPQTVSGEMSREEVLKVATRAGPPVLAVVDAGGRFQGTISPDELTRIARDIAEEDMLRMGGVAPGSGPHDGPIEMVRRRAPWLLIGLMGALVAAVAVGSFEHALMEAAILATFIPVVMATAGNAGMQASTVAIQALTSDTNWRGDQWARILREVIGASLNGVIVGAGVFAAVMLASLAIPIDRPIVLALTGAIALFLVTVVTGTFGAVIPGVLRSAGIDPTVATGIFITTASDVFGVLIFFAVAAMLYL